MWLKGAAAALENRRSKPWVGSKYRWVGGTWMAIARVVDVRLQGREPARPLLSRGSCQGGPGVFPRWGVNAQAVPLLLLPLAWGL